MITLALAIALMTILLCLHELGHVVAAKVLDLSIEKVGFSLKPWPHPFVAVRNVSDGYRKVVFLSAGLGCTLLLFAIAFASGMLRIPFVYYAFCAEIILETNPFYSDFTTMFNSTEQHSKNYQAYYQQGTAKNYRASAVHFESSYYFSLRWYVHLFLWMVLIHSLLSSGMLKGYFLF